MLGEPCTELVVLSHLRWEWVWQRPQHLVSRLGRQIPTWFVEEPTAVGDGARGLIRRPDGVVERVWYEVPGTRDFVPFGDPLAADYPAELAQLLPPRPGRIVWLYTAMALDHALALEPELLVYDVMDDLASFSGAAPEQRLRHLAALRRADVVFTGGRSLHRGVTAHRHHDVHLFASGVEPRHFAPAIAQRPVGRERPVAGYVGVVDERLDLGLIAGLAERLPDWDVRIVGPVAKIDPASLPQGPNLHWDGPRPYAELPAVMAGFDVALMPFARNEATASISPTKTLEYFAAGLPVVSTRVPDVVADHSTVVTLADDADGFAAGCRRALAIDADRLARVEPVLARQTWDAIAARMAGHITEAVERRRSPAVDGEMRRAAGSA